MIQLPHSITVYIPSQQRNGAPIANRQSLLDDTIAQMVLLAGGATVTEGKGYWQGEDGLAIEPVTLVSSYCQDLDSISDQVMALCQQLATRANQEAVSLAMDTALYFVEGS